MFFFQSSMSMAGRPAINSCSSMGVTIPIIRTANNADAYAVSRGICETYRSEQLHQLKRAGKQAAPLFFVPDTHARADHSARMYCKGGQRTLFLTAQRAENLWRYDRV